MFNNIKKRLTAGILAATTLFSSFPTAFAADSTPTADTLDDGTYFYKGMELEGGEVGDFDSVANTIEGLGRVYKAKVYRGSEENYVSAYCANKGWRSPSGTYVVDKEYGNEDRQIDWILAAFGGICDAHMGVDQFLSHEINKDGILTADHFGPDQYYVACQIAAWVMVGDADIEGGSKKVGEKTYTWTGSREIADKDGGHPFSWGDKLHLRSGSSTSENGNQILVAATRILKYCVDTADKWRERKHKPWPGSSFSYYPGSAKGEIDVSKKRDGYLSLETGVAESGLFRLEENCESPDGTKTFWVLPMSAATAIEPMADLNDMTVTVEKLPEGAYIRTVKKDGQTVWARDKVVLDNMQYHSGDASYAPNGNGEDWAQAFELCIPEDKGNADFDVALKFSGTTHHYGSFHAQPKSQNWDNPRQTVILIDPPTQEAGATWKFASAHTVEEETELKIIKKDPLNPDAKLVGAEFKIEYKDDKGEKIVKVQTTSEDGTTIFTNLPLGAQVTITETKAPEGYKLMLPSSQTVTLPSTPSTESEPFSVTFYNEKKREKVPVRIIKLDKNDLSKPLQGAKIQMEILPGGEIKEVVTDENGIADFGEVPINAHITIHELEAPPGYEISYGGGFEIADTLASEPLDNGVYTETLLNEQGDVTDLVLIKKDQSDPTKTLAGAIFKVEWTDEGETKSLTSEATAEDGKVRFSGIPLGATVTVAETQAPPGYTPIAPMTITMPADKPAEGFISRDIPNGIGSGDTRLEIVKSDSANGEKLKGAEFEISWPGHEGADATKVTTDASGKAQCDGIPLNTTVTVKETKAPSGYKPMSPNPITRDSGSSPTTITLDLKDEKETTGIKIVKADAETGEKLNGAVFKVTWSGNSAGTQVTIANGEGFCTGIPLNTQVTIEEIQAPPGYDKVMTQTITSGSTAAISTVTVDETKTQPGKLKILKIDADTGEKLDGAYFSLEQIDGSFKTSVGPTQGGEVSIPGEDLPSGSYRVTEINAPEGYTLTSEVKTFQWDQEGSQTVALTFKDYKKGALEILKYDAVTNKKLAGAAFDLMKDGKKIDSLITDETGRASKSGLAEGFYQLVEVNPPAGYLKDAKVYEVYIDPEDTAEVVRKINIPNYQNLAIRVIKVDNGTSVPLKGFTFELYKGTTLVTSGTTDDNGEIMFTDLEPGDYRVREAGGTEDYAIDAPDQFVTLVKDESEIPTLTFRNDKKRDYRIKKVDAETGAAIPGVVFEIFRDGQSLGQLPPTDANGEVQLEHTEFGTYNVKEVTVPDEYVKSDETFIMEIDKDSQDPFVFTIPNKHKKKLTLKKIDEETGAALPGVTFEVFLENNSIGHETTDANGEIIIDPADPGTYRFEETRELTGYELLRDPINIEMTADKDAVVTAKNHKRHDLIIYKRDATTHAMLDGVTFEIFRDEQSLGDFITKNGGKIVIENAEPGTYRFEETRPLQGYELLREPINKKNSLNIHRTAKHTVMLEPLFLYLFSYLTS